VRRGESRKSGNVPSVPDFPDFPGCTRLRLIQTIPVIPARSNRTTRIEKILMYTVRFISARMKTTQAVSNETTCGLSFYRPFVCGLFTTSEALIGDGRSHSG